MPPDWPPALRSLISSCWADKPSARPSFANVLKQLYLLRESGTMEVFDMARPSSGYNPTSDCGCGCSIM